MVKIDQNQQIILNVFLEHIALSSSEVYSELVKRGSEVSLVTVKRNLSELKKTNLLLSTGSGRSIKYVISSYGRFMSDVDYKKYCSLDPDKRSGLINFNMQLFDNFPTELFSDLEIQTLDEATKKYKEKTKSISPTLEDKELERFVIELSWKSSKIEGNTYTLLDTERLIAKGIEAPGHDKSEAKMILNHKEAFKFIRNNSNFFKELTLAKLEEVHKILVKDLNVNFGLRSHAVGVIGSIYKPLDNIHQIKEALQSLCNAVNSLQSPYAKATFSLLGISYIQPFEDGNKRTSRIIANAILLSHGCSPLSYRSVDENEYREAMLVFYELNSIIPFKKIFIEQYIFAVENYSVK